MKQNIFTFIDLFAGAGGLSEGFVQAGFKPIAHIELMPEACKTLKTRTCYYDLRKTEDGSAIYKSYLRGEINSNELYACVDKSLLDSVICERISEETLESIYSKIQVQLDRMGIQKPDVIIGGPPCQAYSIVGRSRTDMSDDPRNHLYKYYIDFLQKYQPKLFVFENVTGIKTAGGGKYFADLKNRCYEAGFDVKEALLCSENYGVLQKRRREIVIGINRKFRKDYMTFPFPEPNRKEWEKYVVGDLFRDLPPLMPGEENNIYFGEPSEYLLRTGIRTESDVLTWHLTRPIRPFDREIYRFVIQYTREHGATPNYTEIPERLQTHHNKKAFLDRFKMVNDNLPAAQTMVAHISKDGHYYIYPDIDQLRSLSVREAARIQSFPDNFYFEGSRTSAFTQIGNAVPPLLAKSIGKAILELLINASKPGRKKKHLEVKA